MSDLGERGPRGDHGQAGHRGERGPQGERGTPGSTWLTRNVARAFLIFFVVAVGSYALSIVNHGQALGLLEKQRIATCEDGNERSNLQREDFIDSHQRLMVTDLEKLFGIPPDQVAEFRRLSREAMERRITRLPYRDCETGQKVPAPPAPTTTSSMPVP